MFPGCGEDNNGSEVGIEMEVDSGDGGGSEGGEEEGLCQSSEGQRL